MKEKMKKIFRRYDPEKFWKRREDIINSKNSLKRLVLYIMYQREMRKNCSGIPITTYFKGVPDLPHGLSGIWISKNAKIGKNCTIFQQVTIGANTFKESSKFGSPTIGDNCYIGAGAKIIGNIIIGDNVKIGANAVVTEDIPSNSTVVLSKSRIIQNN